jgi:hypothetical protein
VARARFPSASGKPTGGKARKGSKGKVKSIAQDEEEDREHDLAMWEDQEGDSISERFETGPSECPGCRLCPMVGRQGPGLDTALATLGHGCGYAAAS